MRVAFVGKGGSGKTTLTALTAQYLAAHHRPVLAIDADINQHLAQAVGYIQSIPPLGLEMLRLKDYLRGNNTRIATAADMIKTTPPGTGSQLLQFSQSNPVFDYFERQHNGMRLMAVGPFTEDDLGIKCYHSKVGAVELLLNHLIDGPNEYVLIDMTAGADAFASGLFTKFDLTLLVVEPTLKSVSVYNQYKQYAQQHDVTIKVVGNKVVDAADSDFLQQHIGHDLITTLHSSAYVRSHEKGQLSSIDNLEANNRSALEKIITTIDAQQKNWQRFYRDAVLFHRKNATSWANAAAGKDLEQQIDPDFNLPQAIRAIAGD